MVNKIASCAVPLKLTTIMCLQSVGGCQIGDFYLEFFIIISLLKIPNKLATSILIEVGNKLTFQDFQ